MDSFRLPTFILNKAYVFCSDSVKFGNALLIDSFFYVVKKSPFHRHFSQSCAF